MGWIARLAIAPPVGVVAIFMLGVLELFVPIWAESAGRPTPWNARHVSERYGLFTIIVIGECVLAATTAIQAALAAEGFNGQLLAVAVGGLLLVFALWWLYFKDSAGLGERISLRSSIAWGYGQYVVFASAAAVGAGLQVAAETTQNLVNLPPAVAASTVAVPVVAYLLAVGVLHGRADPVAALKSSLGLAAVLVLIVAGAAAWIGAPTAVFAMGVLLSGMIAAAVVSAQRRAGRSAARRAMADVTARHAR